MLGSDGAVSLAGSRWAWQREAKGGALAALDLPAVAALAALVRQLVAEDLLQGVHDVADGGLALALAEMVAASEVGAELTAPTDHLAVRRVAGPRVACAEPARAEPSSRPRPPASWRSRSVRRAAIACASDHWST